MGYRSQWALAAFGEPDKMQEFIRWMESYPPMTIPPDERASKAEVMSTILDREQERTEDGRCITFGDDQTKCYTPWDEVIAEIREKAEETGVDMAYGRFGENLDDFELDQGEEIWIDYSRDLGPVQFPSKAATSESGAK